MSSKKIILGVILSFFVMTLVVYGASLGNDFVRWDDGLLIYENPIIREISPWSVGSAFLTYDPELYIPLTLLSYQIDYLIGGTDPFLYHLGNLVLHTLNALLVLAFVYLLTGRKIVALFCGLLFAVHPLHTEAVAWASARKDVLAAFFFLGSLVAYVQWRVGAPQPFDAAQDRRGAQWKKFLPLGGPAGRPYTLSIFLFFLALLSKVSVITLPIILLLIDYREGRRWDKAVLMEKVPYFALSVLFGVIALGGKQVVTASSTLGEKILMACKSTVFYLEKLFVPTDLSVLYPYTDAISIMSMDFFIPVLLTLFILGLILHLRRKNRELVFGLSFFLIMLLPTFINFAKDGDFYFASDRYAYLPSIGIIFLVVLGAYSLFCRSGKPNIRSLLFGMMFVTLVFSVMSFRQARVWASSEALFANVLEHYPNSHRAHNNLGNVWRRQEKLNDAIDEFEAALAIRPMPRTHSNLGAVYRKKGLVLQALQEYRTAIDLDPSDPEPHFGLGIVFAASGDFTQALVSYQSALYLDPAYAEAFTNIGAMRMSLGQTDLAIRAYQNAIEADRFFVQAYYNLGVAYKSADMFDEAIAAYEDAIALHPSFVAARLNLALLLYDVGRSQEAVDAFEEILRIDPRNASAISALRQLGVL